MSNFLLFPTPDLLQIIIIVSQRTVSVIISVIRSHRTVLFFVSSVYSVTILSFTSTDDIVPMSSCASTYIRYHSLCSLLGHTICI